MALSAGPATGKPAQRCNRYDERQNGGINPLQSCPSLVAGPGPNAIQPCNSYSSTCTITPEDFPFPR